MANITKEILYDLYVTQGLSFRKCAEKLGMPTHGGMPTLLKKFGIPARKGKFHKGHTVGNRTGDKASGWKGGKKTVKCDFCGEELKKYPSLIKNLNFCNMECKGNYKRKDMLGKKVGKLIVIKQEGKDKYGKRLWVCECDCGKTKSYTASDLSVVKSCGCLNYLKGENNPKYKERVIFTCPICGATKKVVPSYIKNKSTCGKKACTSKFMSEMRSGENSPRYNKVEIECYICGKKRKVSPSYLSVTENPTCGSKKCRSAARSKLVTGEGNPRYLGKDAIKARNVALFDIYAPQISFVEKVRRDPKENELLQVKCKKCGKWHTPKRTSVFSRIRSLKKLHGESNFYCSDDCKQSCPVFGQKLYPKGFRPTDERQEIVDPEIRNLVLDRDDHQCQKCGATEDLAVHHIEGVMQSPITANDLDNCLTVCHNCHAEIHSQPGCTYYDYQRDSCETIKEAVNL